MKDILVSLKPYYYYLIGEGIKTYEIRKSMPKADDWSRNTWFYMSKDENSFAKIPKEFQDKYRKHFGKVGLKCVCDTVHEYYYDQAFDESMGCFIDKYGYDITDYELGQSCLSYEDFENYGNTHNLYAWHITDLVIYDKPKELREFYVEGDCDCMNCKKCYWFDKGNGYNVEADCNLAYKCVELHKSFKPITRPPMSWMFIEGV